MASSENPQIEKKMLAGCASYVFLSLGGFLIGAWPFFFWTRHWLVTELTLCASLGLFPAIVVGLLGTRRYGIPGGAGFFASALATAIFLYLRLWQMFMGWDAHRSPEPEYPRAFVWLIPIGWVVLVALITTFVLSLSQSRDQLD